MIPILYDGINREPADILADSTMGVGALDEAISCTVLEERNGAYDLSLEYPVSGKRFPDLVVGMIIKAKPSETKGLQMFRIYNISKPINGIITVSAHHISYDLNKTITLPGIKVIGVNQAGSALFNPQHIAGGADYGFNFWTDISNSTSPFKTLEVRSIRSYLGGTAGSLLDVFGGEYEWDNMTVKLHAHRGTDNGVAIEYGKNLIDLTQEIDNEKTYNAVMGYAVRSDVSYLGEVYKYSGPYEEKPRVLAVDFTDKFGEGEEITAEKINAMTESYMDSHKIRDFDMNIKVSFVALWQTPEYASIAPLERVSLCDTVHIIYPQFDITASGKVISTEYDVLTERYREIEIGNTRSTIADTIYETQAAVERQEKDSMSFLREALSNAQDLITGTDGGYIYIKRNANGQPEEIFFLDAPTVATATNVIRINQNGIGFSQNGVNGPFNSAWTIDGKFTADNITGGVMRAGSIEGIDISGPRITFTVPDDTTANVVATGKTFYAAGGEYKGVDFSSDGGAFGVSTKGISLVSKDETLRAMALGGNIFIANLTPKEDNVAKYMTEITTGSVYGSGQYGGIKIGAYNEDRTQNSLLLGEDGAMLQAADDRMVVLANSGNLIYLSGSTDTIAMVSTHGAVRIGPSGISITRGDNDEPVMIDGRVIKAYSVVINGATINYWGWE